MSLSFELGISSDTAIVLRPEYSSKPKNRKQTRSDLRARNGALYKYIWSTYDKIKFNLEFVPSSDATIVNSWWESGTDLLLFVNSGDLENKVVDGTFDTDSSWTGGAEWDVSNGVAYCDGTQTDFSNLTQSGGLGKEAGIEVDIRFTVSSYGGSGQVRIVMGTQGSVWVSANGTYTRTLTTVTSEGPAIRVDSSFIGYIDNLSIYRTNITEVRSVQMTNKEQPFAQFNKPYNNLMKGKIELEGY